MRLRDWLLALCLVCAVAVSIFAVGGVLRWSQAVVAVLTAVALASTAPSARSFARVSPLVALLGAAVVLTALQLIPLPDSIAFRLAPTTSAMRADGSELLNVHPWTALTADAGATLGSLAMLLTLLGLAVASLRMAASERGRYRLIVTVAALCGLAAVVTEIHSLFGIHSLYGLYEPEYARPPLLGPLLNDNSLACLTAVGATLGIALAAHRRQRGWIRAIWLLVVIACGAVTVGTVSRGATLALVGGSLVTVALLVAQRFASQDRVRKRRGRFISGALPMAVVASCLVILVIYSNAGNVERQLSNLSFQEVRYSRSKFAAWRSSLVLLEDAPILGVGRGAFEAPFTRVHEASGLATYAYLENEYLQAAVDWGIPGALLLAIATLWLAYAACKRWRDGALVAGPLGALVVVAMQSNVDFGLEFLGLAAPVTVLAATVAYVPLRESDRPALGRGLRVAHAIGLVIAAGLLSTSLTKTLDEDRSELAKSATLASVRASVQRHPLDYYGYAVAAELMERTGDPRAIRLLNHAMALHPTHPQLHRMAARMLLAEGRTTQATVEYAAALRTTPDPKVLLKEIVSKLSSADAAASLPTDYAELGLLVTDLEELGHEDVARVWLARVLEIQRTSPAACDLLYRLAERGDLEAVEIADHLCADRLPDFQTRLSLARALSAKNGYTEVIRLLRDVDSWQSRRDDKINGWLLLCDANRALGYTDEAKRCLRRLDASPDMLDQRRPEILHRIDEINHTGSGAAAP